MRSITFDEYQEWYKRNCNSLYYNSPYHQPSWVNAVSRGINFEPVFIEISQASKLYTVIPAFFTKRGPFNLFGSPLRGALTSTLGPVSLYPIDLKTDILGLFDEVRDFARQKWGVHYCRFSTRFVKNDSILVLSSDWVIEQPGSYWLDISGGEEAVWNGLKSDCRRNIRKAQKLGIEVVPFNDMESYYRLLEKTYQRHGSSSWHPKKFFRIILEELVPQGIIWAWGASYQGEIIAACLFFHNDQEVHFISGASNPQFGNLPTSYILHWHAIETAIQKGLSVYYSDSSGVRSIDQFKEAFNPVLKKRYTMIWSPAPVKVAQSIFLFGNSSFRKLKSITKPL